MADQTLAIDTAETALEIKSIKAQTEAIEDRLKAIDPKLIAAIQAADDRDTLVQVAEKASPPTSRTTASGPCLAPSWPARHWPTRLRSCAGPSVRLPARARQRKNAPNALVVKALGVERRGVHEALQNARRWSRG